MRYGGGTGFGGLPVKGLLETLGSAEVVVREVEGASSTRVTTMGVVLVGIAWFGESMSPARYMAGIHHRIASAGEVTEGEGWT